jgi:hypothetical protein
MVLAEPVVQRRPHEELLVRVVVAERLVHPASERLLVSFCRSDIDGEELPVTVFIGHGPSLTVPPADRESDGLLTHVPNGDVPSPSGRSRGGDTVSS